MPKKPPRSYNRDTTLDKQLLSYSQAVSFPDLISALSTHPITQISKLISFKIAITSFKHSTSDTYIPKTKAYDIYKHLYEMIDTKTQPLNSAHFGKVMKLVHNPKTKRVGSRVRSIYVYDQMEVVEDVRLKYEEWVKQNMDVLLKEKEKVMKDFERWLRDESVINKVMIRCDLILSNFGKFDLVTMSLDWDLLDLRGILQENGIDMTWFEIMDIFNTDRDVPVIGFENSIGMNKLKVNILNKIHSILKYTENLKYQVLVIKYTSTRILEELTMYRASSFGSYWIMKCLFDELIPICYKFYRDTRNK